MRATSALPLTVARVLANDPHTPTAADHLTLVAHCLNAWSNFHRLNSLVPVRDAAARKVVGGQLYLNTVARKYSYVVHPHFSGNVR